MKTRANNGGERKRYSPCVSTAAADVPCRFSKLERQWRAKYWMLQRGSVGKNVSNGWMGEKQHLDLDIVCLTLNSSNECGGRVKLKDK